VISLAEGDLLTFEEIARVVRIAAALGLTKVRITGGEPLVRRDLPGLIRRLREVEGIREVTLTTNGQLLASQARGLAHAGLTRVNVSLDSLDPARYRKITGGGSLQKVWEGIRAAEDAGLAPIKINMIPMRGFNEHEIPAFADLTRAHPWHIRFIELMPMGIAREWDSKRFVGAQENRERLGGEPGPLPVALETPGPAQHLRFPGARGIIGLIGAVTEHFCGRCNRLRLTSDGKLRPCLFSGRETDLKPFLRSEASDAHISGVLRLCVDGKPEGHSMASLHGQEDAKTMRSIGG
jgi:cyclic pyranopterin phosphate synthase